MVRRLPAPSGPAATVGGVGRLVYGMLTSLDGYTADGGGDFSWAAPDEEVHAHVNDQQRGAGTYLYGRRMYETMAAWETDAELIADSAITRDFAEQWQAADKVVVSSTQGEPVTGRTRVVRHFDPEQVQVLKTSSTSDLTISGPGLAAHALRAGLVDELQVYLAPVVVGEGTPYLPPGLHLDLELVDERRFASGFVFLRHAVVRS